MHSRAIEKRSDHTNCCSKGKKKQSKRPSIHSSSILLLVTKRTHNPVSSHDHTRGLAAERRIALPCLLCPHLTPFLTPPAHSSLAVHQLDHRAVPRHAEDARLDVEVQHAAQLLGPPALLDGHGLRAGVLEAVFVLFYWGRGGYMCRRAVCVCWVCTGCCVVCVVCRGGVCVGGWAVARMYFECARVPSTRRSQAFTHTQLTVSAGAAACSLAPTNTPGSSRPAGPPLRPPPRPRRLPGGRPFLWNVCVFGRQRRTIECSE